MSINSLTEMEIRRVVFPQNPALGGAPAIPPAVPPPGAPAGPAVPAVPAVPARAANVNNALSMLVKYIPTESVTLYVGALAAITALKSFWPAITAAHIYWFFAVMTPVIFLLVLLGKRKALRVSIVPQVKDFPWWKLFACTVAFLVWALAVPGNPYVTVESGGAVVGFFAIFISTILSLLEQIFDRPEPQ